MSPNDPMQRLADFAASLQFASLPAPVVRRTEDLCLDGIASALGGKGARPVESIARFIESMGPEPGPSEVLIHGRGSSARVAAVGNAAASHAVEQDDVHNGSVFHPATVAFPPALAVAQAVRASGHEALTVCVAGDRIAPQCPIHSRREASAPQRRNRPFGVDVKPWPDDRQARHHSGPIPPGAGSGLSRRRGPRARSPHGMAAPRVWRTTIPTGSKSCRHQTLMPKWSGVTRLRWNGYTPQTLQK